MLNIRKFLEGIGLVPKSTSTADTAGELEVLSSDNRLRYHDGTSVKVVTLNNSTDTLTNKTIDADLNTITNIENADIKAGAAIDASKIADGSVSSTEFQYLANVTSDIQTQLNSKASSVLNEDHILVGNASNVATGVNTTLVGDIEADSTNGLTIKAGAIVNTDINASAAIDASKIADGSVSSTEFQYLANVTSDIQTQINGKISASSTDTLTNKTIDGDNNTVQDLALSSLKTNLTDANKFLVRDGSGAVVSNTKDVPAGVVVGTSDTQTLTNKTLTAPTTDVVTWDDQASTPSNPSAGFYKTYFKTDGKLYRLNSSGVETEVGSGGPGFTAGLNLMLLDTAANNWSASKTDNYNAEQTVGDWVAYADAAGTSPVDMTGGSPNTTISRTTTNEINGTASFEMVVSSGATRQGEGVSCVVNIPTAYRGRTVQFKFPFTLTGTVVEDDFRLFAYDITNATVITPFSISKIIGSRGMAYCNIAVSSNCEQMRVGIHIARASNTGAVTIQFDDVVVSPENVPAGLAGSDVLSYTPTFTGFGTVSNVSSFYRRVGDSIEVDIKFTSGTATAVEAQVTLPTGLIVDSTKVPSLRVIGYGQINGAANSGGYSLNANGGLSYLTFGRDGQTGVTNANGNALAGSGDTLSIKATVPISGWSSNVSMGESSSFLISSYLANGTRVTGSAPTRLGEYRSYLRNAGAATFTETNGSPATAPSAVNGIRLYNGNAFSSADTNNEPTKYEIFVGKNKTVKVVTYLNTGRTGYVDITPLHDSSAAWGYNQSYDPITGILAISPNYLSGTETSHFAGRFDVASVSDAYFDIQVSENALSVSSQQPRSMVWVHTGNGYGSTNTKIKRFTTVQRSIGTAITYADSATLGGSFTINEDGVYAISFSDEATSATISGISLNSNQLTTDIQSISASTRLAIQANSSDVRANMAVTVVLAAGDVVRAHTRGVADGGTPSNSMFIITKVSS